MITKQEYIEALERMKVSYYNLDGCMSAMNKFKEDINLLAGLVNEHFEEKVETNFDHYKDGIIELCIDDLAISKGKVVRCCAIPCSECDFKDKDFQCINHEIMKWLKQPYKKPTFKLNQFEYNLLQRFSSDFKFKEMGLLKEMKEKGHFKNINGDELIKDILKNCEVVG